jgi:hypothetical protein
VGGTLRADHAGVTPTTRRRLVPWLAYLLTLLSAWPVGEVVARSTPQPEGACSGIGFGCSLYGWDAAGFLLMVVGIPFALVLAVVLAVLSILPERFAPAATAVALVGLAVPWAFLAYAGLS